MYNTYTYILIQWIMFSTHIVFNDKYWKCGISYYNEPVEMLKSNLHDIEVNALARSIVCGPL